MSVERTRLDWLSATIHRRLNCFVSSLHFFVSLRRFLSATVRAARSGGRRKGEQFGGADGAAEAGHDGTRRHQTAGPQTAPLQPAGLHAGRPRRRPR